MNNKSKIKLNDLLINKKTGFWTAGTTILATPVLGAIATGFLVRWGAHHGMAILSGLMVAGGVLLSGAAAAIQKVRYQISKKLFYDKVNSEISEHNFIILWQELLNNQRYNLKNNYYNNELSAFCKKLEIKEDESLDSIYQKTNMIFPGLVEKISADYIELGQIEKVLINEENKKEDLLFLLKLNNYKVDKLNADLLIKPEKISMEKIKIIEKYFVNFPAAAREKIIAGLDQEKLMILKEEIKSSSKIIKNEDNLNKINNHSVELLVDNFNNQKLKNKLKNVFKDYADFNSEYQQEWEKSKEISSFYHEHKLFFDNFDKKITQSILAYQQMIELYQKEQNPEYKKILEKAELQLEEQADLIKNKIEEIKKEVIRLNLKDNSDQITINNKIIKNY